MLFRRFYNISINFLTHCLSSMFFYSMIYPAMILLFYQLQSFWLIGNRNCCSVIITTVQSYNVVKVFINLHETNNEFVIFCFPYSWWFNVIWSDTRHFWEEGFTVYYSSTLTYNKINLSRGDKPIMQLLYWLNICIQLCYLTSHGMTNQPTGKNHKGHPPLDLLSLVLLPTNSATVCFVEKLHGFNKTPRKKLTFIYAINKFSVTRECKFIHFVKLHVFEMNPIKIVC